MWTARFGGIHNIYIYMYIHIISPQKKEVDSWTSLEAQVDHARKSAAQAVKAAMGLKPEPYQCPPVGHERIHGGDVTTRYAIYI